MTIVSRAYTKIFPDGHVLSNNNLPPPEKSISLQKAWQKNNQKQPKTANKREKHLKNHEQKNHEQSTIL